ncbi:spermidine synthase [Granulicella arctica]|uniref:Spermidine synthase n=1 Tax=Granulicella arctica TaxID=940613 RepID=A0A7Y9PE69_9BACT|nr:fused MFS/spermidine synthase [Granulicella arctica]NYF78044.1 spermidine synthase [Granulicella arctica]
MSASRFLYGTTIFLSAFLLFVVEPMAAKELLPALGGSSAVWITCLVFFQLALLLGYLYAHWLTHQPSARTQRLIHLAALACAVVAVVLTLRFRMNLNNGASHPVTTIFTALTLGIGLPFLLLGSTSPLLQIWMARTEGGNVPYRLFALSNAGSLLALILYPTLIEPSLTLHHQRTAWSIGFALFAILGALLAYRFSTANPAAQPTQTTIEAIPPTSLQIRVLWFLLPMAAAMQLSAVTSHLTRNIAAIPLLWTMPLAVYLLTFILAFEFSSFYRRGIVVRFLVLMLASLGYALSRIDASLPIGIGILFFLAEVFVACLFCHAEVHALRPARPSEATLFYLLIAAGGVAGTFFVAIASPLLFVADYDLAIAFFLTALLALIVTWSDGWPQRLLWSTGTGLLFALLLMLHIVLARQTLLEVRNFYGALRVKQTDMPAQTLPTRMLLNGTIRHGTQMFAPGLSRIPTSYYAEDSGIGLALTNCCADAPRRIGIVGLGVGTLAAYGRPGDQIRFYEINPLVRPIAENLFTYLRDSAAQTTFADGDARTSLAREAPQHFNVLAVDAFTGDAIPLHLLTTQAMQLYRIHLAPGGILAFHVSNQYLDLAPEIAQLAAASNMEARSVDSPDDDSRGEYRATWVLVTANQQFLALPNIASRTEPISPVPGLHLWTDDYSSLLPILRWAHR